MRRMLLITGLLLGALLAGGCRQAACVWEDTRASVEGAMPKRCCPDATGTVYTEPIYGGGCAGDNRIGSGGTGAFKTP